MPQSHKIQYTDVEYRIIAWMGLPPLARASRSCQNKKSTTSPSEVVFFIREEFFCLHEEFRGHFEEFRGSFEELREPGEAVRRLLEELRGVFDLLSEPVDSLSGLSEVKFELS